MGQQTGQPPIRSLLWDPYLDSDALTIGFVRRFAAYKRPALIFRDIERLKRIINYLAAGSDRFRREVPSC